MKKIMIICFIIASGTAFAQHGWQRVNYMQSTIFSSEITINGNPAQVGDVLGAFVNNECRMIAPIFLLNNKSYVSSVIHGDSVEEVEFRLWIQEKDSIFVVPQKVTCSPGGSLLDYSINIVMNK